MYTVTKLTNNSQTFVSELSLDGKSRRVETSIALARIIAMELTLPTSQVDDLQNYFNLQLRVDINSKVYQLNEIMSLDVKAVLDLVYKFYYYRYNVMAPTIGLISVNRSNAIVDFFNISKSFDPETIRIIEENSIYITELTLKFNKLLTELQGSES